MLTVETDTAAVEERLRSGRLACPGCSGVLAGGAGLGPARSAAPTAGFGSCRGGRGATGCRATHVLLPVLLLLRRADTAVAIGAALAARTAGDGHRAIAALLGRPVGTVRGWLRRFGTRIEEVRVVFTRWCRALAPDPVLPSPAGSGWADAIAAVTAAARVFMARFSVVEVPVWQVASAVSSGRLLAPGWPARTDRS